jgi:hypothetical protein
MREHATVKRLGSRYPLGAELAGRLNRHDTAALLECRDPEPVDGAALPGECLLRYRMVLVLLPLARTPVQQADGSLWFPLAQTDVALALRPSAVMQLIEHSR